MVPGRVMRPGGLVIFKPSILPLAGFFLEVPSSTLLPLYASSQLTRLLLFGILSHVVLHAHFPASYDRHVNWFQLKLCITANNWVTIFFLESWRATVGLNTYRGSGEAWMKQEAILWLSIIVSLKARQESSRSYEEVCSPALERCQFLFTDLHPAMSSEVCTLSRLRIRNTRPRWARIVQEMIREKKKSEGKEKPAVREEEDAVHLDTDHSEEKALEEKENVEQKTKQKVKKSNWPLYIVTLFPNASCEQTCTCVRLSMSHITCMYLVSADPSVVFNHVYEHFKSQFGLLSSHKLQIWKLIWSLRKHSKLLVLEKK